MYKYAAPIMFHSVTEHNRAEIAQSLKECGIERVFFCIVPYPFEADAQYNTPHMTDTIAYFKAQGLEVGVWFSSFGHGVPLSHESGKDATLIPYTKLEGLGGKNEHSVCPLDEGVVDIFTRRIKEIAAMQPDLIMLDDDYRLNNRNYRMGCTCPLHLQEYYRRIGEVIEKDMLEQVIFSGGANRYRTEWMGLMSDTLVDFAARLRAAVDEVDSSIRMSFCTCWDMWDFDGADCLELAKTLAGGTKPFIRTFGAPYHDQKVSMAIESTRAQAHWCRGSGIELFAEGDVYPRPRYNVPARQLELFDLALIASGETNGILKYMYDYVQPFGYETGYTDRHLAAAELRRELFQATAGKRAVGVRVVDVMHKVEGWQLPENAPEGVAHYLCRAGIEITKTAKCLLTDNAIPTTYESIDAPLFIMGENARHVTEQELDCGAVLDAAAAVILTERGIDVGLLSDEPDTATGETYLKQGDTIKSLDGVRLMGLQCSTNAVVETVLTPTGTPGSYRYENGKGQRFFVIAADLMRGDFVEAEQCPAYTSNYYRKTQLTAAIEYVGRSKMPVKTTAKCPNLYVIATESSDCSALTVSVINPFIDDAADVKFELGKQYSAVRFIGCSGSMSGDTITVQRIEPFGFAAFEVRQ